MSTIIFMAIASCAWPRWTIFVIYDWETTVSSIKSAIFIVEVWVTNMRSMMFIQKNCLALFATCKFIKEFGMDISLTWMTKKKMQDYLFRLFYSFFCHFYLKILPLLYQLIVVASSSWIREISSISISSVVISVKTKMTFIMVQPQ